MKTQIFELKLNKNQISLFLNELKVKLLQSHIWSRRLKS